jgi:nonribosomal peptide synthetase protein VioO
VTRPPVPERATAAPSGTVLAALRTSAARHPQAPAIIDGDSVISYSRLQADVDHVAIALARSGVQPGDLVGVAAERSAYSVTSMLAVMRARAAYVPLDPAFPADRLRYIAQDAGLRLVLCRSGLLAVPGSLPQDLGIEYLPVDADPGAIGNGYPATVLAGDPLPGSLAYVIYTSGSTGQPKGVLVSHQALATASRELMVLFGLGHADRMLSFASLSWDTAGEEIYPALHSGAVLVIDSRATSGSIPSFLRAIRDQHVTAVDLPTGFWAALTDHLELTGEGLPPSLRLVIIGGEEVRAPQVRSWSRLVPGSVRLLNTYGQTETVLVTHAADIGGEFGSSLGEDDRVPIGRPLPHVRQDLAPRAGPDQPHGQGPRELLVSGCSLAWGYHGRPGLTAQRFLPLPAPGQLRAEVGTVRPGTRAYRTGDLVRQRADGSLEFVGRNDRQVKIRGYRVEPEEIERVLLSCPGVAAAAVVPFKKSAGLALAAVYVPATSQASSQVTTVLAARLPAFAVPERLVPVRKLPLLANGKVDYIMIRKLVESGESSTAPSESLSTAREIAEMAGQVLGHEYGIHDDFFDSGGDSLQATRLISRIYRRFDAELTFVDVFEYRTPQELAEMVMTRSQNSDT